MKQEHMLVVPKWSKFEWDQKRYRLSPARLIRKYARDGMDAARIVESYERQQESIRLLKTAFPKARFIDRSRLTRSLTKGAGLVVSLGGDNHFQYVSHFVGKTLMLGINSDPMTSEGRITTCRVGDLLAYADQLFGGAFQVEEWARIQVSVDGKVLPTLGVSDLFLGEMIRTQMSRHQLMFHGKKEEQKCSGLIVATGAGSTGWFDAASRFLFAQGSRKPKDGPVLQFLATEPYSGRLSRLKCKHGVLKRGMKMRVRSLNDSQGVLVIDAQRFHPFREGAVAEIRMGAPLWVISGWNGRRSDQLR